MVFQRFWKSGLHSKDQRNWFPNRHILYKCQTFDSDLSGRMEACSCAHLWICMKKKIKTESIFQNYRTFKILMRTKQQQYDIAICPQKLQNFIRDQDGRYQASGHGEYRFSKSRWIDPKNVVWEIGRSVFQCRKQNRHFSIEIVSAFNRFLITTLIEKRSL